MKKANRRKTKRRKREPEKLAYSFIRFSSRRQELGDSLRRQIERTETYAREKGLKLDEKTRLTALGLSGYSGAHLKKGTALHGFLEALKKPRKNFQKPKVLIIEALDRLSRMEVMDAFDLFSAILKAGVEIHTLVDKQVYTRQSLSQNVGQIFISLGALYAAHAESANKASRLRSKWELRKKRAADEVVTSRVPLWCKVIGRTVTEEGRAFGGKIIPWDERVAVVKEIFRMKIAEKKGKYLIAKELTARGIPTWGKGMEWQPSYVHKILRNPAVTGDFVPMLKTGGIRKRDKNAAIVRNYYPPIVSRADFERAKQELVKGRKGAKHGKQTGIVSNLFSGLVWSGNSGKKMYFTDKRSDSNWQYLTDRAGTNVNYWEFEARALYMIDSLDWKDIDSAQKQELEEIDEELEALRSKQADLKEEADYIGELIRKGAALDETVERSLAVKKEREKIAAQMKKISQRKAGVVKKPSLEFTLERNEDRNLHLRTTVQNLVKKITVYHIDKFSMELRDGRELKYKAVPIVRDMHPEKKAA